MISGRHLGRQRRIHVVVGLLHNFRQAPLVARSPDPQLSTPLVTLSPTAQLSLVAEEGVTVTESD